MYKSVAGGTPGEILTSGGTSFNVTVAFLPGTSVMYIYHTAANVSVYSHSGAAGTSTKVRDLTAANTVTQANVIGNDLYFQESATFEIYKSVAGVAALEVTDDSSASFAGAVTMVPGTTHMYFYLNAANSGIYSHTGAPGDADLIDTTPAANTVNAAKTVGDDLYYQYSAGFSLWKSVAGAAVAEIMDDGSASFASAVGTIAGSTHIYIYQTAAAGKIYSHSGAAGDADLVGTLAGGNTISNPTIVGDDLYYQENTSFEVYKSVAGGAASEVTDPFSDSFAAAVAFVPGETSTMYIHGNVSGGNATVYSHVGPAGDAEMVLNGAVGTFNSANMITVGDNLFFEGATTSPKGLFVSINGQQAKVVGDYNPSGDDNSLCTTPYDPVSIGSRLFFVANDGGTGCELWVTSGTTASTYLVADVNVGQISANPTSLTAVGTRLYFVARDNSLSVSPNNTYLFYSDAPDTSVSKVTITGADLNPNPVYLMAVGTKLYFGARKGGVITLYTHDGTSAGNAVVKQDTVGPVDLVMSAGTEPFIVPLGNYAIIRAARTGTAFYNIYRSDSTAAVTEEAEVIKEINTGANSNPRLFNNATIANTLFFSADDGTGVELWKTDGTFAGTVKIRNVNGDGTASASSNPTQLTVVGANLYFTAADNMPGGGGDELYISKWPWTTAQKLTYTTGFDPLIQDLMPLGSKLLFVMSDDGGNRRSLYATDGTIAGTTRIRAGVDGGAGPVFTSLSKSYVNDHLYYAYQSNMNYVHQLFKTDGTQSGTGLVKALNPSPDSNDPDEVDPLNVGNFSVVGDFLIFPGNDGTTGVQLWYSNSLTGETAMVENHSPNDTLGSWPTLLGTAGDAAYYFINDRVHGATLYKVVSE